VSGLGAATADGLYGAIAAFGLTAVSDVLVRNQTPLRIVGGAFLLGLGGRILLTAARRPEEAGVKTKGLIAGYATTFGLTVTNPLTILSFAAVFTGLGLVSRHTAGAGILVLGVFLGSALWWLFLSGVAGLLRHKATDGPMTWINRISGTVIIAFGVLAMASLV